MADNSKSKVEPVKPDLGLDASGKPMPRRGQNEFSTSDSGSSGNSTTRQGGPGTAGSVPAAGPGAPGPFK